MPSKSGGFFTSVQTIWVEIPNILLCILALGWLWGDVYNDGDDVGAFVDNHACVTAAVYATHVIYI